MRPLHTNSKAILAAISALALLLLATLAIASGPGADRNAGNAPGQGAGARREKRIVLPDGTSFAEPPAGTPITSEQAEVLATEFARKHGPINLTPEGREMVDRALPSIENLSYLPRIFVATVEGKRIGLKLRERTLEIYTPLELSVERVLVDEIDPPAGFQYVAYGGTTASGETVEVKGMHPPIEVGRRYLFYTIPLMRNDGTRDPRYMTVNYAMPIDAAGQLEDFAPDGSRIKLSLQEAAERIRRGAAERRWSP